MSHRDTITLTLFTTTKPFTNHQAVIQRNALRSWTLLQPECEIILFGDESGSAEIAAEFGLRHVPDVRRNDYGTPLVSDLFEQARQLGHGQVLGYVNADLILMDDFMQAVQQVIESCASFLMVGRRWDISLYEQLDFAPNWQTRLQAILSETGKLHSSRGIDYFVFSRDVLCNIPEFAIGRMAWDNWLLYGALSQGAALIDASAVATAVHQDHDYSHSRTNARTGIEAQHNMKLARGTFFDGLQYSILDATHILTPHDIQPNHKRRWRMIPRLIRRARLCVRSAVLATGIIENG